MTISDDIVEVGGRVYVKATATLSNEEGYVSQAAFAREPEMKKGMDESQITGCASSYARKYALNGLLAIDDTRWTRWITEMPSPQKMMSRKL